MIPKQKKCKENKNAPLLNSITLFGWYKKSSLKALAKSIYYFGGFNKTK
jgi:hypothetical protein